MKSIIAFVLFLFLFQGVAYGAEATIKLTPKNPEPYSKVTLTLVSYDLDINTSMIVWKVGGKEVVKGMGEKTISINLGGVGTLLPVSATVFDAVGNIIQSSINISPQSVTLLWESLESYVPPFYEGKALPAEGSKIKVTAFPNMNASLENLSYTWSVDDSVLTGSSGAAKRSVSVPLEILADETTIKGVVRSAAGEIAEKTITVAAHPVLPLIYEYDDLLGTTLGRLFTRRLETSKEVTLSLEPFYLSTRAGLDKTAVYSWYLDGLPVTPPEKTVLALRPKAESSGVRTLAIVVENTKRRLQKAQADLQIVFDTR